jgi:ribosome-binding protein aMBF1 (putative translation factor)
VIGAYEPRHFQEKHDIRGRSYTVNIETTHVTHHGQVVAQYRKVFKWSQEDLAEALRVDVRTVQRMEKQAMIKDLSRRRLLIGLLGIPAVLMGLEHEPSPVQ